MFSSIILIQSSKQDFSQHSSHSSVFLASLLRARVCHVVGLKHWWQSKKCALPHRRWSKGTTESFNRRQSDMKSNPPLYFQLLNFKDDPYKAYLSLLARFPNTAVNPFAPKISLVTLLPVCHEILTRLALRVGH